MTAYLVVRAVVADPEDRAAFDHWYRTEHLPDAMKAFSAAVGDARLEHERSFGAHCLLPIRLSRSRAGDR